MTSGQTPRMAMLFVALALASAPALAQIYKYRDASGRMVVSDKPPPGTTPKASQPLEDVSQPASKPVPPKAATGTDPKLDERKKQQEAQAKAEDEERKREQQEELKTACVEMRGYLRDLEGGNRIARRTASGEREFLSDEQRTAEIERTRKRLGQCDQ